MNRGVRHVDKRRDRRPQARGAVHGGQRLAAPGLVDQLSPVGLPGATCEGGDQSLHGGHRDERQVAGEYGDQRRLDQREPGRHARNRPATRRLLGRRRGPPAAGLAEARRRQSVGHRRAQQERGRGVVDPPRRGPPCPRLRGGDPFRRRARSRRTRTRRTSGHGGSLAAGRAGRLTRCWSRSSSSRRRWTSDATSSTASVLVRGAVDGSRSEDERLVVLPEAAMHDFGPPDLPLGPVAQPLDGPYVRRAGPVGG